jgi:3-dehydroquinate synthetase
VVVGNDILDDLPSLLHAHCAAQHYAVVADSHVAPTFGERVVAILAETGNVTLTTFPAGEWNKSRETWAEVTDAILRQTGGRDVALVAVGGGVTGDVTGFVAATCLGGLRYVHVATTLLAMVDGVFDGTVSLATPLGRGLVGTRHVPSFVVADIAALVTLPPVHMAAGAAALLRNGLAADTDQFDRMRRGRRAIRAKNPDTLTPLVTRNVEIVADLAAHTAILRSMGFGRVLGEALEVVFGYELLYGEALALGMLAETAVAVRRGASDDAMVALVTQSLDEFALPVAPPDRLDLERLVAAARQRHGGPSGTVSFAVPRGPGTMSSGGAGIASLDVSADEIEETVRSLGW